MGEEHPNMEVMFHLHKSVRKGIAQVVSLIVLLLWLWKDKLHCLLIIYTCSSSSQWLILCLSLSFSCNVSIEKFKQGQNNCKHCYSNFNEVSLSFKSCLEFRFSSFECICSTAWAQWLIHTYSLSLYFFPFHTCTSCIPPIHSLVWSLKRNQEVNCVRVRLP